MNKITRDYTEHDVLYYKASEVDVAIEAQEAEIGRLRAAIAQPATVQPAVSDAEVYAASAQAVKLLRHKFWGAGESDCPKDIKASNGELHTMRCKVCGDNWRKSVDVCFGASPPTEGEPAMKYQYVLSIGIHNAAQKEVVNLPNDFTEDQIEEHYNEWCSNYLDGGFYKLENDDKGESS